MASDSGELARRSTSEVGRVDPVDEPSAEWGWHGSFPRGTVIGGVITIILCAAFFIGPYQSHTQYLWLGGTIIVIIGGIVAQVIRKRNAWRR